MTSRIAVVAIDAVDVGRVVEFWVAALGWRVVEEADGVVSIAPVDAGGPSIDVCPVPERKAGKNRLHLDLRADGSTQREEVDRLVALGATPADVGQPADASWVVLADPEGNEFCVLSRSVQEVEGAGAVGNPYP